MKIFIHTDLEGVSGMGEAMHGETTVTSKANPRYPAMVDLMLGDINAAIDGAIDGGATEITVLDSHGGGKNFTADRLGGRAEYDKKTNGLWWGKLDASYAATFFIGAHAMAGTINGFLDHTQSSLEWFDYAVNGRRYGELAQWAMVAGEFGVPLVMVSGDEAACAEARAFFNPVETAAVKQGRGRMHADCLPLDEAHARIREAARRALGLIGRARPFRPQKPIEFRLTLTRSDHCDNAAASDVERLDARTVRWVRDDGRCFLPNYDRARIGLP